VSPSLSGGREEKIELEEKLLSQFWSYRRRGRRCLISKEG